MKIMRFAGLALLCCVIVAVLPALADRYVITDKTTGITMPVNPDGSAIDGIQPVFRADIQSTSVDWEAATGLRLREYKITFSNAKAAGQVGWEMYYLDEFPCYGSAQYVRAWVSAKNNDGFLRANCLRQPKQIKMAYRVAARDDWQSRTTGILTCKVDKNLVVNLAECGEQKWSDFAKE
jgi:hypothetical protein